jgi:hypothetical protein
VVARDADDLAGRLAAQPVAELGVEPVRLELEPVVRDRGEIAGEQQQVTGGDVLRQHAVHVAHGHDLHRSSPPQKKAGSSAVSG